MPLAEKCLTLFPKRQRLVKLRPPKTCFQRRRWHPTPVLLPGKSHGRRSLVGCSPWGWEESDMTERLHFHFSLSCIGEGNGNPLQCSCLETPRDRGAWWAAVYGVAQESDTTEETQQQQQQQDMLMIQIKLNYPKQSHFIRKKWLGPGPTTLNFSLLFCAIFFN